MLQDPTAYVQLRSMDTVCLFNDALLLASAHTSGQDAHVPLKGMMRMQQAERSAYAL